MPFYNEPRLIESAPLTLDDTDVSFWDYLRASAGDAWNDSPMVALKHTGDIYMAQVGEDTVADLAMQNGLSIDLDQIEFTGTPALSLDEQTRIIKDSGLEGHVKAQEGYNAEALNIVMQDKQDEIDRALTREQAPAWMAPFGFAVGLGTSFLDPINIALSFVPVLGQQRVMRMLASASGAGGRAAVRAGVGAVEGAVGAAMVEPLVYLAKNQQQADYGMTDSLLNIAFGAVMGGAMHSAAGAWGDWVRSRRGRRNPWEIVSPTDQTEILRKAFADDLFSAAEQAGASITREQADLTSVLFDVRARTWAYDEGMSVQDYYDRYRPDFRTSFEKANENLVSEINTELTEENISIEGISKPSVTQQVEEVIDGHRRIRGLETSILNGQTSEPARYELRELTDIIPSHDPEAQFEKRTDYPEGVQERPYHSDSGEQEKVLRNAATLDPRYLLNDNPDAVNGPPLVTESGIVLGGNSRTMSMQLAYGRFPERAEGYRNALRQRAALFGLNPAAVDTFERPVLVRVVPGGEDVADMAVRSRLYNQSQTQGLQAKAEGVSKARLLTVETMDTLATDMEDFDSLREFLASAKSKDFINALVRDGVIEQTQLSRLTDASGKLNDAGKDLVENALRGHIVPDYDVLNATPPAVLNKLDRAIPALSRLKARGEGWDMSSVVTRALRAIASAESEGKDISIYLGQGDLFQVGPKPAVQALALTFSNATQKEVQLRFTVLADAAEKQARGQTSLFAQTGNTPAREFVRAFMEPVASVDGEAVPSFNPTKSAEHAAIQYAYEHGGKGHSISTALEELQKKLSGRKTPAEEKARARELMGELGQFSGAVNIYEPKLGQFFSYRKGDELFQTAYHGTPHRFDEFSLEHIGEGEGNQAHGWGLYFAQERGTSERYKTGLGVNITLDGKPFYDGVKGKLESSTGNRMADDTLLAFNGNIDEAIAELQDDVDYGVPEAVEALDVLQSIKEDNRLKVEERGQLFEVDIPENDVLLDEQKPLSEQPHIARLLDEYAEKIGDWSFSAEDGFLADWTGRKIYSEISEQLGSPRAASEYLNAAGIKGITYDGQQDGRSFVVFDDKAIQVLNTFYQFVGEKGAAQLDLVEEATTRLDNLDIARKMESAGKDAKTIKLATGWERGADGKWRYEIDDSLSSYSSKGDENTRRWHPDYVKYQDLQLKNIDALLGKAEWTDQDEKDLHKLDDIWGNEIGRRRDLLDDGQAVLEDMLIHEELFNAYPELRRIPVRFAEEQGARGVYRGKTQGITLSPGRSDKETFSTLMHEVQHAIQEIEGFARGGNAASTEVAQAGAEKEYFSILDSTERTIKNSQAEIEDLNGYVERGEASREDIQEDVQYWENVINNQKEIQQKARENIEFLHEFGFHNVSPQKRYDYYTKLSGETEARNTQSRMSMTLEERLASLASETEDVAREEQIFFENTIRAAMAEEAPPGPKAAVTFDAAEDAKAIISFFQSADVTSAPHEIYHIFRRELAETAMAEGASEKSRQMWRQACEFVGAEPGQAWTREMEEKFAMAGERFLTEGVAPRPDLQGLFEKMRQWFLEIYTAVESAGVELSDGMRKTFGDMLALSPEESDAAFRYGLGRLIEQSPVEGMDTSVQQSLDEKAAPAEVLAALQDDSVARLNEAISYTSKLPPEDMKAMTDAFNAEIADLDAVISAEEARAQIMREAALCDLRR